MSGCCGSQPLYRGARTTNSDGSSRGGNGGNGRNGDIVIINGVSRTSESENIDGGGSERGRNRGKRSEIGLGSCLTGVWYMVSSPFVVCGSVCRGCARYAQTTSAAKV